MASAFEHAGEQLPDPSAERTLTRRIPTSLVQKFCHAHRITARGIRQKTWKLAASGKLFTVEAKQGEDLRPAVGAAKAGSLSRMIHCPLPAPIFSRGSRREENVEVCPTRRAEGGDIVRAREILPRMGHSILQSTPGIVHS